VKNNSIPNPAVKRLSLYLRRLEQLADESIKKISSRDLAASLHITATQVRKDLGYIGQFGRPGVGYRVIPLIRQLRRILGTDKTWKVVVVGIGAKVGKQIGSIVIHHTDDLPQVVRAHKVKLGIVAVPAEVAQEVTDILCDAGVIGILNFAPTTLQTPDKIAVGPVDLAASLEQISFQVRNLK